MIKCILYKIFMFCFCPNQCGSVQEHLLAEALSLTPFKDELL